MSLKINSSSFLRDQALKGISYKYYALAIIVFAVFVRMISLTSRYFWCDEASSVLTSRYDVEALLYHASFDVHPPLYYLLLHCWMALFGDSILATRLLSLLFGVMTVALAMSFMRWLANERTALLAGWFMAIMPLAVRYSQEARMYALMGLLTIAATMALAMWLKKTANSHYLAIYAMLMALSFYTHYFTIFTLFSHWLVVLMLSCKQRGERYIRYPVWWLANVAIGLVFIPWLLVLFNLLTHLSELRAGGDVGWIPEVTWCDLPAMYWRFFTGHDGSNYTMIIFWLLPTFCIVLCSLPLSWCEIPRKFNLLLISGIVTPVTLVFAISWSTPIFVDRYLYSAALCIPLALGLLINGLKNGGHRISLLFFFSVLFGCGVFNDYSAEKDDFKTMVYYINSSYQLNDTVVVSKMFYYLSYIYYNKKDYRTLLYTPAKSNGIPGKPNAYGFGTFFYTQATQTYVEDLSVLSGRYRRVWLVSGGNFNQDFGRLPQEWVNTVTFKNGNLESRLFVIQPN